MTMMRPKPEGQILIAFPRPIFHMNTMKRFMAWKNFRREFICCGVKFLTSMIPPEPRMIHLYAFHVQFFSASIAL